MSQLLFCSLIKSLSGCSLSNRLHVFFCDLYEAKTYIAKREKWDSVGRSGKIWVETRHNLILGLTLARSGGGTYDATPHEFFSDSRKTVCRIAAEIFHSFHGASFAQLLVKKNWSPGHIRSGLQVTLSDVSLATLTPCHSHLWTQVFKLLDNSSSNLYILDFLYSQDEVRSISWPAHVKSKISTTSFSHEHFHSLGICC